ncbi:MAG: nitroreductase family deazaflavin-dependent oxidoreductase [Chloroflexi bacterium]|nr:MAG: nitroreductase family deazaflavin-dependent oxidoreductase [Chloroflexota bacterium]TME51486.1 MAG: nitroreductase family deazaflavin-dependent oxidoreductase [Chloroflexota bacterium]
MAEPTKQLDIPPRGTRGAWTPWPLLVRLFRPLMRGQLSRYRKATGPTQPVMMGMPTVLLTTIGSRTGTEHTHVLGGFQDGDDAWIVVASNSGASTHPHWFINMAKNPDQVWLEVGNRKLKVQPMLLKGPQREAAFAKVVATSPRYGGYRKKTDREIPIVRLKAA